MRSHVVHIVELILNVASPEILQLFCCMRLCLAGSWALHCNNTPPNVTLHNAVRTSKRPHPTQSPTPTPLHTDTKATAPKRAREMEQASAEWTSTLPATSIKHNPLLSEDGSVLLAVPASARPRRAVGGLPLAAANVGNVARSRFGGCIRRGASNAHCFCGLRWFAASKRT